MPGVEEGPQLVGVELVCALVEPLGGAGDDGVVALPVVAEPSPEAGAAPPEGGKQLGLVGVVVGVVSVASPPVVVPAELRTVGSVWVMVAGVVFVPAPVVVAVVVSGVGCCAAVVVVVLLAGTAVVDTVVVVGFDAATGLL